MSSAAAGFSFAWMDLFWLDRSGKTGQNPSFVYIIQNAFTPNVESSKEISQYQQLVANYIAENYAKPSKPSKC